VLSKQSRLLLDPNRHLAANSLFRKQCDEIELDLNKDITIEEVYNRIQKFHVPYFLLIGEVA
jgi:predicted N-formylglutamate amidohydrolase